MAKNKDIKGKNMDELSKLLREKQDLFRSFRLGSSGSKSRNVREGRTIRRDIARILTALNRI